MLISMPVQQKCSGYTLLLLRHPVCTAAHPCCSPLAFLADVALFRQSVAVLCGGDGRPVDAVEHSQRRTQQPGAHEVGQGKELLRSATMGRLLGFKVKKPQYRVYFLLASSVLHHRQRVRCRLNSINCESQAAGQLFRS